MTSLREMTTTWGLPLNTPLPLHSISLPILSIIYIDSFVKTKYQVHQLFVIFLLLLWFRKRSQISIIKKTTINTWKFFILLVGSVQCTNQLEINSPETHSLFLSLYKYTLTFMKKKEKFHIMLISRLKTSIILEI